MPSTVENESLDPALIIPLIKRSVGEAGRVVDFRAAHTPVMEPLAGELSVGFVLDLPNMFQFVSQSMCDDLGLATGELRSLAVRNLTRRRPKPKLTQGPSGIGFMLDGDLEASLLLVDHLWDQLGPQIPGELIAAVPARDLLMVTGSEVTGGTDALTGGVQRGWESSDARLRLTRSLLIRHDGSWHVHPGSP